VEPGRDAAGDNVDMGARRRSAECATRTWRTSRRVAALDDDGTAGPTWGNRSRLAGERPDDGEGVRRGRRDSGRDADLDAAAVRRWRVGGRRGGAPMALVGDGPEKRLNPDTEAGDGSPGRGDGGARAEGAGPGADEAGAAEREGEAEAGGQWGDVWRREHGADDDLQPVRPGGPGEPAFIRKLFGGNAGPSFRGIGAQLGNPDIGMSVRRCC